MSSPLGGIASRYGEVVFIEYDHRGRPFSVEVGKPGVAGREDLYVDVFDFDWCERDGCLYYHNSGSHGAARERRLERSTPGGLLGVWCAPSLTLRGPRGGQLRAASDYARCGWQRRDAAEDPFEDASEGETAYCSACGDRLPDDSLCDHLFIDGGTGEVRGPGNFDVALEPERARREVIDAVRALGCARSCLRAVEAGDWPSLQWGGLRAGGRDFPADVDDDSSVGRGVRWITGLGPTEGPASRSVAGWLRDEVAIQDARRSAGERCYAVAGEGGPATDFATALAEVLRLRAEGVRGAGIARRVPRRKAARS